MKRPDILLVNPWIHDFAAYDLWARPMGLAVLATRLRRDGWEPRLVDCLDQDHPDASPAKLRPHAHGRFRKSPVVRPSALEHVPRAYSRYGLDPELIRQDLLSVPLPRAILVTSMMTYWYPGVQETIRLLRECFPGVPIILGGIYASLAPDHAREHSGADEVLVGPGEQTLSGALFRFTGVVPPSAGSSPSLEFSPALDLMRRVRFLPLLTSRGCPFRCSYCASGILAPQFVRRNSEQVVEEIEDAHDRYGISDIALYDDAFLMDARKYAVPLLQTIAERIPGLRWHTPNGLHASAIDADVAGTMKSAGFETIRIGLESTSGEFQSRTGGKTDVKSFLAAVKNLKEAGFSREQIGVYLLVGLPGQSRAQIEDDVDRVIDSGAFPKLAEYSPIPGTETWAEALGVAKYPIEKEPLFHNCTLLPAAEPEVDWTFLRTIRMRIRDELDAVSQESSKGANVDREGAN